MNNIIEKGKIENMIYEIRGIQVMLDSDLAKLYQVETKRINEKVYNNVLLNHENRILKLEESFDKFLNRYMFQLTKDEYISLKSQFGTSSYINYGGVRKIFIYRTRCILINVIENDDSNCTTNK